ncbi:allantoin racemase [Loktanella ponticola]|uniref:Allantoin racemase n=1 Tax=Yoonia ponticola TaxID=1524255 RepID=A0A7W9EXX6_9RHOB|nr:aspartate/glutamate racemase family protein [Yoonia ponticola]MBB5720535.1 allantoin racemase [Yoonia ponticola]
MRILFLNPNATEAMTDSIVSVAKTAAADVDILGWTNHSGPAAIQGPEDGERAISGLMDLLPSAKAEKADVIVIGCFDDTGLDALHAAAHCPVIGIGQAGMAIAALYGGRFGVVTTLAVSVPVIEDNVMTYGHQMACAGVFASGLPVLEVEAGGAHVTQRLLETITVGKNAGAHALVLGCAGMARLKPELALKSNAVLVDGVSASVNLAHALV